MRYYIIAGERSGDLHGSNLMKAIRKYDSTATFRGFGGDYMTREGLDLFVHYDEMAFMGFKALVTNAWTIFEKIKACKADIQGYKPDVIILIDYGGFNRRIAKFGRSKGIKVFYYIPPKVWAWYTSRAWELKANVDRMFVILPFEKDFFKKFDFEVDYVGNPVLDAVKEFVPSPDFLANSGLDPSRSIVALLPGSRKMELKKIIPLMADVARNNPGLQFVVAAIRSMPDELYAPIKDIPSVRLVYDKTYDLLTNSRAAIVTSGTATLETGLFRVPQVVVYKASAFEAFVVRRMIKVAHLSLVNLIADKPVVKELTQEAATSESVSNELNVILPDGADRTRILRAYDEIYRVLDTGSASDNAGRLMVKYLTESGR